MNSSRFGMRNQFNLSRTTPILTAAFAFGALHALSLSTAMAASAIPSKAAPKLRLAVAQNVVNKLGEQVILAQVGQGQQPPNGGSTPIDLSQVAAELGVPEELLRDAVGSRYQILLPLLRQWAFQKRSCGLYFHHRHAEFYAQL